MPVPNYISDLAPSPTTNSPIGTETVGPNLDDYLRTVYAFVRQVSGSQAGASAPPQPHAYQMWADTGTGRMRRRNADNTGWIDVGALLANDASGKADRAGDTFTGQVSMKGVGVPLRLAASSAGSDVLTSLNNLSELRWSYGLNGVNNNFVVNRHNAAGIYQDTPLSIDVVTGLTRLSVRPVWQGGATPWDSVNLPNPVPANSATFTATAYSNATAYVGGAYRVSADIGGPFVTWSGSRTAALQVDSLDPAKAYIGMRWTRWGGRHIAAIDAYEGGTTSTECSVVMHLDGQNNAWTFGRLGISRGAGGNLLGSWDFTPGAPCQYNTSVVETGFCSF
ncbi:hypothetical protein DAI43_15540 [Achromobacter xylosoxidans]|nr:hypothetical protein DAI43_15540 [Achromobacter xylosoxidans]